jgi:hypothetical protein
VKDKCIIPKVGWLIAAAVTMVWPRLFIFSVSEEYEQSEYRLGEALVYPTANKKEGIRALNGVDVRSQTSKRRVELYRDSGFLAEEWACHFSKLRWGLSPMTAESGTNRLHAAVFSKKKVEWMSYNLLL